MYLKPIQYKHEDQIAKEWDQISPQRDALIKSGKDVSFSNVLVPCILKMIGNEKWDSAVDCGCGTGILTNLIAEKAEKVAGIDISSASIEIAKKSYAETKNLVFYHTSIEGYSQKNPSCVSLCVANMVLMDVLELDTTVKSISRMLKDGGVFLFSITHPCFWPIYWNYFNEPWFDYRKEMIIESEFSTSLSETMGISTHVHRPLSRYFEVLHKYGFELLECDEPYPQSAQGDYRYSYPRFLCVKCRKSNRA